MGQTLNTETPTTMKRTVQRGAQAVEFALVLPFFVLILLLIVDLGFLVYNKAVITNASREAARSGTLLASTWSSSAVASVACNYARNALISTRSGTRTSTCSGSADPVITVSNPGGQVPPAFGDPISVTVTFPYQGFLTSFQGTTIEPAWSLRAESTMNHE